MAPPPSASIAVNTTFRPTISYHDKLMSPNSKRNFEIGYSEGKERKGIPMNKTNKKG
jgi:hypothetical protein